MPYSAEDLLRDCASSKRSRLKGDLGKYQDIWIALSAWIRSRVERKLGAVIPGFGQWVWYSQAVAPGDAHALDPETAPGLRAGFSLSDRFMKTYNLVSKVRDCAAFRQTKLKEVNVYEVAIRFSQRLKKDEVFCGLKDLLQQIGEVAHSCKPLKIQMAGVGSLRAKERKVSFEYDPEFLAHNAASPLVQAPPRPRTSWRQELDRSVPHLIGGPFRAPESEQDEYEEYMQHLQQQAASTPSVSSRPSTSASFMSQLDNGHLSPGGQRRVQRWLKQEKRFEGGKSARVPPSRRSIHHPHTEPPKRTEPTRRKPDIIREQLRPSTAGSARSSVFRSARKNKKPAFELGRLVI
eukprot:TRINITY_DN2529_c0_g2_i4.p1 TRINITY_DN2529_c0_g2~~TRINITY_DN2529_c0_g2_i4.p1  ORF type:complete len:349 (+),score=43.27 TRINITY_DN2529_c0_g2_i4:197-1243(+)